MSLRLCQPFRLRQTLWRCLSTTRPRLRTLKGRNEHRFYFEYPLSGELTKAQTLKSPQDLKKPLNSFVATVYRRLENLLYSKDIRTLTAGSNLSDQEFEGVVQEFRDAVMSHLRTSIQDSNYRLASSKLPTADELYKGFLSTGLKELDRIIVKYFRHFYLSFHHASLKDIDIDKLKAVASTTNPGEWFPAARSIRRKIVMHV